MDPLTAGLNTLNTLLAFIMKIYEDTPVATRQANNDVFGKFVLAIGTEILNLQSKINAKLQ
jgi:hypothetical protein